MSAQPELTAAAAAGKGTDLFAEARAQRPQDRLVLFRDRRTSLEFVMAVPPSSPWFDLLPPQQEAEIAAPDGTARRE